MKVERRESYPFNKGAVGDILGCVIDSAGRVVECPINQRAVTVGLAPLRGNPVLAIVGGNAKRAAITAALRSGVVTDENIAATSMKGSRYFTEINVTDCSIYEKSISSAPELREFRQILRLFCLGIETGKLAQITARPCGGQSLV